MKTKQISTKTITKKLLGPTDPKHFAMVALGSFLAVFSFVGAFALGDSSMTLLTGNPPVLLAGGYGSIYYDSAGYERFQRGSSPNPRTDGYTGRSIGCGGPTADGSVCSRYDTNKDGILSSQEIDRMLAYWDQLVSQLEAKQKELENQARGGGSTQGSGGPSNYESDDFNIGNEYGCLSATGC